MEAYGFGFFSCRRSGIGITNLTCVAVFLADGQEEGYGRIYLGCFSCRQLGGELSKPKSLVVFLVDSEE